jgi:hypothetical protein
MYEKCLLCIMYRNGGGVGMWSEATDQAGKYWHLHAGGADEIGDSQARCSIPCICLFMPSIECKHKSPNNFVQNKDMIEE